MLGMILVLLGMLLIGGAMVLDLRQPESVKSLQSAEEARDELAMRGMRMADFLGECGGGGEIMQSLPRCEAGGDGPGAAVPAVSLAAGYHQRPGAGEGMFLLHLDDFSAEFEPLLARGGAAGNQQTEKAARRK